VVPRIRKARSTHHLQASEREALLGRTTAAAADVNLLGSASTEHMWLRGRLVLRQPGLTSVDRRQRQQQRREDHEQL